MIDDPTMLWNAMLTLIVGVFLWWTRGVTSSLNDVKQQISETRETSALRYATKDSVEKDIDQILMRFDRLETKVDKVLSNFPK